MGRRFQARRGNGRFTRNTMENTFGLHVDVCEKCLAMNPYGVGETRPTHCHVCKEPLGETPQHGRYCLSHDGGQCDCGLARAKTPLPERDRHA